MLRKSFLYLFFVLVLLLAGPFVETAEANSACMIAADFCMEKCNEWFQGDTWFDGLQRSACRTGCAAGYLSCVVQMA